MRKKKKKTPVFYLLKTNFVPTCGNPADAQSIHRIHFSRFQIDLKYLMIYPVVSEIFFSAYFKVVGGNLGLTVPGYEKCNLGLQSIWEGCLREKGSRKWKKTTFLIFVNQKS